MASKGDKNEGQQNITPNDETQETIKQNENNTEKEKEKEKEKGNSEKKWKLYTHALFVKTTSILKRYLVSSVKEAVNNGSTQNALQWRALAPWLHIKKVDTNVQNAKTRREKIHTNNPKRMRKVKKN